MKVKEFLNVIDLETLSNQQITIIIPLKDLYIDLRNLKLESAEISDKEKIVFNSDESSVYEDNKYAPFGIEPCFKSEEDEIIDVRESDDEYKFVYDEDGQVWVLIDFSI